MFKKIAMFAAAAMLALALPCTAFADASPQTYVLDPVTGDDGVVLTAQVSNANDKAYLIVEPSADPAASVAMAVGTVKDSFSVYMSDGSDITGPVTLTFNVGSQYAGKAAHVYVVHGRDISGAASELTSTAVSATGAVSVTIDALSYYTVSVDETSQGTVPDSSSKSPSTGVNPLTVALVSAAALAVAAGAVVVARKKIAE